MEVRQQNLQLMIQNALLVQQFTNYITSNERKIESLKQMIPKPHEIDALVEDKLKTKIKLFDASRDSAIKHLKKLGEK